jgi:GT2 family glycosyltransferase
MAIKLSVIILAHNKIDMTLQCLTALAEALANLDHEVILLDNGSTEDLNALRSCASLFLRFLFLRCKENMSFSIANNRCVREATGDFLLFLNNDVFLRMDTLLNLISPLKDDESVGCTGGKLLYPEEKSVQSAGMVQMLWGYPSNYAVGAHPEDRRVQDSCERFALTGAMLCISRALFHQINGFDERYLWGIEDVDLCLKAKAIGLKAVYCPEATAVHCESVTLKTKRSTETVEKNYRLFRHRWDPVLMPAEQLYVRSLKELGIRRLAIFGTGTAACGLHNFLTENGIQIAAFTSSHIKHPTEFMGKQAIPLSLLSETQYDRLIVASQYFLEFEHSIRQYDPLGEPLFPALT